MPQERRRRLRLHRKLTSFLLLACASAGCVDAQSKPAQQSAQAPAQKAAQTPAQPPAQPAPEQSSAQAPIRSTFHIRYINGSNVYIDGGRDAGLTEDTQLILKQNPTLPEGDPRNHALEPGIVARLSVISVASTSAVCAIKASAREVTTDDVVALPDAEVDKIVQRDTLGNTRQYPMVISFTQGDPLDEEAREEEPRPPLPEVNQMRGRIGFDVSSIQQLGQTPSTSNEYGMVFRADFTRMFGTHWNLNGYWRGQFQTNSALAQATLQDTINRTYLMSLSYINPDSPWMAGIGRLYLPWANSLEVIDGAYLARGIATHSVVGLFAGSTPDPAAWDYNPDRRIGGLFYNAHGGSYDHLRFSSTAGVGVEMLKWTINRPFAFTENDFSYKRLFSIYHSMQVDRPTANPGSPALPTGLGQSLLSMRVEVTSHVVVDLTDTYFRDVPTYDPTLVGTGLLDTYLYQGLNGGARIEFPRHITGYFSLGQSNDSTDPKNSLNKLFGATISHIANTGFQLDARYSQFDSAFASGTYSTLTLSRDLQEHIRLNLQAGKYAYNSPIAATSSSKFVNLMVDSDLGARLFVESMYTAQRGGSMDYNQWTTTLGYRFDNRAATRRASHAVHP